MRTAARHSHAWIARVTQASYVFWLMFVLTQPVPIHVCPLPGQATAAQAPSPESAQRVLASGDVLCESGAAAQAGQHGGTHTSHHGGMQCHCLGTCCASAVVTPSIAGAIVPVPATIAAQREQYPTVDHAVEAPAYRLPPATAPPIA